MDNKTEEKRKDIKLSAQELDKLEDIVYRYGGESMVLRTKEDTLVEVLQAYKTLNKVHGASKQCLKTIFVREKHKTMSQIKKHCFQFMQNVPTNDPVWIPLTLQCIGGRFVRRNGGYISTSIAPLSLGSSMGYNSRWGSLTKKVLLLLKNTTRQWQNPSIASANSILLYCLNFHSPAPSWKDHQLLRFPYSTIGTST